MTLSSPEPEKPKAKRCEPGCECGRHRRRKAAVVSEPAEVFIPAPEAVPAVPVATVAAEPAEVSVLVPARLDRERRDLWEFLRPRWEKLGYEIVEGSCVGPWRKANAVADALSRATGQILVVADADVWCDGVPEAVARVKAGTAWAMPHYQVCRLTLPATMHVLSTGTWPSRSTTIRVPGGSPIPAYAQRPYPGRPGGGIVVLSRESYAKVPMDPRFVGWGQEDESWALALGTMLGRSRRGLADLWHLWHTPAPRQSKIFGSSASQQLHRRYTTASRQPKRMAALLAEMPR